MRGGAERGGAERGGEERTGVRGGQGQGRGRAEAGLKGRKPIFLWLQAAPPFPIRRTAVLFRDRGVCRRCVWHTLAWLTRVKRRLSVCLSVCLSVRDCLRQDGVLAGKQAEIEAQEARLEELEDTCLALVRCLKVGRRDDAARTASRRGPCGTWLPHAKYSFRGDPASNASQRRAASPRAHGVCVLFRAASCPAADTRT